MNPHLDLNVYADPVDLPDDADLVNPAAATVNNAAAALLNRTKWTKTRMDPALADPYDYVHQLDANRINQMNWTGPGYLQGTGTTSPFAYVKLRTHRGAVLDKVTLKFRIPVAHAAVPASTPKLSIARGSLDGSTSVTLKTTDGGGGLAIANGASVVLYEAAGAVQTFSYVCDQNNTIDTAQYFYTLAIFDESGANAIAANLYYSAILTWKTIPDLRGA